MDKSGDTTIGSTAPFTCDVDGECKENKIEESEGSEFDEMGDETPNTEDVPFPMNLRMKNSVLKMMKLKMLKIFSQKMKLKAMNLMVKNSVLKMMKKVHLHDEKDDEAFLESKIYNGKRILNLMILVNILHITKSPMTLPNTIEIELNGAKRLE